MAGAATDRPLPPCVFWSRLIDPLNAEMESWVRITVPPEQKTPPLDRRNDLFLQKTAPLF